MIIFRRIRNQNSLKPDRKLSTHSFSFFFHWYDYFVLLLSFFFCVLLFHPTGDLWQTAASSLTYLHGHIMDFYDYNLKHLSGNDYYPFIYVLFAIWNFVPFMTGKTSITFGSQSEMLYEELLPVLFLILTCIPIYLIIRKLGKSRRTAVFGAFLFLTSGTVFVATICWGMYDVILTFFLVFGIYFMIRDVSRWDIPIAMLFCGLSFATKPYGLIIFLPVLAYRCKKLYQAVGFGCLSLVPILISRLLYGNSKAFSGQAKDSSHFIGRFFIVTIDNSYFKISVFVISLLALVMIAYATDYDNQNKIKAIYMTLPAGAIFYGLVLWHPQWLTLIIPFLCITTAVSAKKAVYMLYDVVLAVFYFLHTITMWPQFDTQLVQMSFLKSFLVSKPSSYFLKILFPIKYESVYSAAIIAVLLVNCILKNPFRHGSQYQSTGEIAVRDKTYAYLRFFAGVGFYVVPLFIWFLLNLKR